MCRYAPLVLATDLAIIRSAVRKPRPISIGITPKTPSSNPLLTLTEIYTAIPTKTQIHPRIISQALPPLKSLGFLGSRIS